MTSKHWLLAFFVVVLASTTFVGCGDDDPDDFHVLQPFAIGNQWVYDYTATIGGDIDTASIVTLEIVAFYDYDGTRWYSYNVNDSDFYQSMCKSWAFTKI